MDAYMGMNLAGLLNMLRRFRSSVSNRHHRFITSETHRSTFRYRVHERKHAQFRWTRISIGYVGMSNMFCWYSLGPTMWKKSSTNHRWSCSICSHLPTNVQTKTVLPSQLTAASSHQVSIWLQEAADKLVRATPFAKCLGIRWFLISDDPLKTMAGCNYISS